MRIQLKLYAEDSVAFFLQIQNIISRNLVIVALDRFADFISDESNIIVRETSAMIIERMLQQKGLVDD